jgi:murein DD-endopeptidase MepM/ murein hydrolase activator NlpD
VHVRAPIALALLAALASAAVVRADPDPAPADGASAPAGDGGGSAEDDAGDSDVEGVRPRWRFDPSKCSDGPRRVPAPRGASKLRAEELGLGTRETATVLLHRPVPSEWAAAARGRAPQRILWPVDDGRWVRGYGYVRVERPDLLHRGVDIAAPIGTIVRAAADGIVAYSDNGVRGYGNLVLIVHANGWVTLYGHASRTTVQPGYRVRRGERIALVGQTGIARGPHVHFELWQNGRAVDPAPYFDGGPQYVQRIAERAAARGAVAAPAALTAGDRVTEAPLAPHPDEGPESRPPASGRGLGGGSGASEAEPAAATAPAPIDGIGTLALVQRLVAHAPTDAMREAAGGRLFSNLLFPVRGGEVARSFRGSRAPMRIGADEGAAVRASADGIVVFAGELAGRGPSIAVLHRNGWVTLYAGLGEIAVAAGDRVERGAWIAHLGPEALEFEVRVGGVAHDPAELLVQPTAP